MALTDISELPGGRVVVDSAPIIYLLEDDAVFAPRFAPFFERAEAGGHGFAPFFERAEAGGVDQNW